MTDTITLTGLVATAPRHLITSEGVPITSFRLASQQRHFDRKSGNWVDGATNWYTVTAFRNLAINAVNSVKKGERVVAHGKLRISDWESGQKRGTNVEIDADALGHDLSWGTTVFTRSVQSSVVQLGADEQGVAPSTTAQDAALDDESGFPPTESAQGVSMPTNQVEADPANQTAAESLAVPF